MSFTFTPNNNVRPQLQARKVIPAQQLWETAWKLRPEASSPGAYLDLTCNPLVGALAVAYNQHRPLALCPDAVWLTITQGLAQHVEEHAEELRHSFVQHKGKALLEVRRNGFVKGSAANDWPEVFSEFSNCTAEHLGDKRDRIVSDFSTTTATSRAASEIVLMDAVKSYFNYRVLTRCGFPSVTLEGTVADWKSLRTRAQSFAEFGLSWWLDYLLPVLDQFVATAEGSPDLDFWRRAYNEFGGSGGPYITGWVNVFFPYYSDKHTRHGKRRRNDFQGEHTEFVLSDFPNGIAKVPFLWQYYGRAFPMNFVGGLVGIEQTSDGTLRPGVGWAIVDDAAPPTTDSQTTS